MSYPGTPSDLELITSLTSPSLQPNLRPAAALQAVEPLSKILLNPNSPSDQTKLALSAFATSYPYLFRYACQSSDQNWWTRIVQIKTVVLEHWRNGSLGHKTAAVKVIQRIIQTQTPTATTVDPRLARSQAASSSSSSQDPNLSLLKPNHPFLKTSLLEEESSKLLQECITTLFTSPSGDLIASLTTSLTALVKVRNQFVKLVVTALTNWSPVVMQGQSYTQIKSVEKVIRLSLTHLLKTSHATSFQSQINQFLSNQQTRMDLAASDYRRKREEELVLNKKRQLMETVAAGGAASSGAAGGGALNGGGGENGIGEEPISKRRKLNIPTSGGGGIIPPIDPLRLFGSAHPDPYVDLKRLPVARDLPLELVVDLVVRTFEGVSQSGVLERAIETVRNQLPRNSIVQTEKEEETKSNGVETQVQEQPPTQQPVQEEEDRKESVEYRIDPLKLDLGEEELNIKAEVPPEPIVEEEAEEPEDHTISLSTSLALSNPAAGAGEDLESFEAPLLDLTESARHALVYTTLKRICSAGGDGGVNEQVWIPLVSRLITRGLESSSFLRQQREGMEDGEAEKEEARLRKARGEKMREVLFQYVTKDLQARMELARLWLNEEWYASKRLNQTEDRPYDHYLRRFLSHICEHSSNEDKALYRFMIDLPEIPVGELERLEGMCLNIDQMQLGFSTLRELAILRPSIRGAALDVLLGLTTHADKRIRNAAIMSVKKWVPDVKELTGIIVSFALSLLDRLEVEPVKEEVKAESEENKDEGEDGGEAEMAMEETPPPEEPKPPCAVVKQGKVVDRLDPPTTIGEVTQHVELLLALCVKEPDLLNPLFAAYPKMTAFARESMHELITPLIRSLGIKHPGVLNLFGTFPAGSDPLLLKIIEILADKQKLPTSIVSLIKNVAAERDLDSRIYALIMPDCHKNEIVRYLPQVVGLLDNTPQQKAAIRSIFLSIIAPPAHFSSVNSLRTRSDSLSPVELMVFLHKNDKEIGIKCTIEAIAICFSMADAFRPEILAAFMQQIVDEPVIPPLFLRTVIQSVTTYKSLQPFVSTTLLSRLISKKIWEVPALWEGFIRCAKAIAPSSFAALLQLPKEWLEDLVKKQPTMRSPLREYVLKKGGVANARTTGILEALDENNVGGGLSSATATPGSQSPATPRND